ncbi:HEAT repeat domain-containing protein [Microbacterium enclense]|uniref:HEAT repeat domain-containing protein n=1 Tax=Microbacterium enclense TaxID=993073 RepID=A0A443J7H5_9MICO|nr:HEAT repeat domain-containing protein [Microbacterium enclense]RWR16437.1 HEAT repeat domain-containing protein [Microbacterium enclense]
MADGDITAGLRAALEREDASLRLRAAMDAGTRPNAAFVAVLVDRCAVEPDFFVRDMLTWALTRHDPALVVPAVVRELGSPFPQARSQGLHTLSKIGDPDTWPAITPALLHDEETAVARAAWRAAAGLVPDDRRADLAAELGPHLGQGDIETRRSLSRAFVVIGEDAGAVVDAAAESDDEVVRVHALATRALMDDPDAGFEGAVDHARRVNAQRNTPVAPDAPGPKAPDA